MISIIESLEYLNEVVVRQKDVGQGIGQVGGRILGGAGGMALGLAAGGGLPLVLGAMGGSILGERLGRKLGKKMIKNPDAPVDYNKALHRVGTLANRQVFPTVSTAQNLVTIPLLAYTNAAGATPIGLATSGGIRALTTYMNYSDKAKNYGGDIAKQMGYEKTGRLMTALAGPIGGLIKPKNVGKNKK